MINQCIRIIQIQGWQDQEWNQNHSWGKNQVFKNYLVWINKGDSPKIILS